jgi:hypothetical protein
VNLRAPGRPTDFVFRAPGGATLRASNFRRNFWLPAIYAANLDGLRIHDLRHTAVALWIAAGASPKEVAQRAGHTSVSFVLDRYGHLFPEADTTLRGRLDELFRSSREYGRHMAMVSRSWRSRSPRSSEICCLPSTTSTPGVFCTTLEPMMNSFHTLRSPSLTGSHSTSLAELFRR